MQETYRTEKIIFQKNKAHSKEKQNELQMFLDELSLLGQLTAQIYNYLNPILRKWFFEKKYTWKNLNFHFITENNLTKYKNGLEIEEFNYIKDKNGKNKLSKEEKFIAFPKLNLTKEQTAVLKKTISMIWKGEPVRPKSKDLLPIIKNNPTFYNKDIKQYIFQNKRIDGVLIDNIIGIKHGLFHDWDANDKLRIDYFKDPSKYKGVPNPPNFFDGKEKTFSFRDSDKKHSLILNNFFTSLKNFYSFKIKTRLTDESHISSTKIVPLINGKKYLIAISYKTLVSDLLENNDRIAGIDLGMRKLITLTTNQEDIHPILLQGEDIKQINREWNERNAAVQSMYNQLENHTEIVYGLEKHSFKINQTKAQKMLQKRDRKIDGYFEKLSVLIVKYLQKNNIHTLIVGLNSDWKQKPTWNTKSNIPKKVEKRFNRTFVQIPYRKLLDKLRIKCENVGIFYKEIIESYTSKCSFVDKEPIAKHSEYVGKRINESFISKNKHLYDADINGSLNIIRLEYPHAFDHWHETNDRTAWVLPESYLQAMSIKHLTILQTWLIDIDQNSLEKQNKLVMYPPLHS